MKHKYYRAWPLLFFLGLSACGGGSSGDPSLVALWAAEDWTGGTDNWVDRVAGKIATVPAAENSPTMTFVDESGIRPFQALVFDGVDDFLSVVAAQNPIVGKTSVTIVALFRTSQGASGTDENYWNYPGPLNGEAPGDPNDWGLTYDAAGNAQSFFNSQISPVSAVSLIDGQIHTMALTWQDPSVFPDGGVARFYVDGVLVGSSVVPDGNDGIVNDGFVIGATSRLEPSGAYRYFNGAIIELRFYDTVKTPGFLQALTVRR